MSACPHINKQTGTSLVPIFNSLSRASEGYETTKAYDIHILYLLYFHRHTTSTAGDTKFKTHESQWWKASKYCMCVDLHISTSTHCTHSQEQVQILCTRSALRKHWWMWKFTKISVCSRFTHKLILLKFQEWDLPALWKSLISLSFSLLSCRDLEKKDW